MKVIQDINNDWATINFWFDYEIKKADAYIKSSLTSVEACVNHDLFYKNKGHASWKPTITPVSPNLFHVSKWFPSSYINVIFDPDQISTLVTSVEDSEPSVFPNFRIFTRITRVYQEKTCWHSNITL